MSKILANTMKSANLKGKTFAIALILVLTLSSALAILPTIKAVVPQPLPYTYTPTKGANGLWNVPTWPGITVSPNPDGVGQPVQVILIIELLPPSTGLEATTLVQGGWIGLTLAITSPNGTVTTLGPYETDPSGTHELTFTPTTVGNYSFQMSFPGQTVNGTGYGAYYANFLPSTSQVVTLNVQQAPIQAYQEAPVPLPSQYWSQPINAQNRAWNTISGPWLMPNQGISITGFNSTGQFNPYTYAPQSAHILWAKTTTELQSGLVGGPYGSLPFGQNVGANILAQNNFQGPIVMGGYAYYSSAPQVEQGITEGNSAVQNQAVSTESCMNLQTGQVIWTVPLSTIAGAATPVTMTAGQILCWRSQQERADFGYLWSMAAGAYKMYDASTGALLAQWGNLPAGSSVASADVVAALYNPIPIPTVTKEAVTVYAGTVVNDEPNPTTVGEVGGASGGGAMLVYIAGHNTGATTGWLACWNSTLAINSYANSPTAWNFQAAGFFPSVTQQLTTPLNWENGIMWNLTIPIPNFSEYVLGNYIPASWSIAGADGNYVVLVAGASSPVTTGTDFFTMAAVNVAQQPMTTTYTTGVGGDTQHSTPGMFAWNENITIPAYDQTLVYPRLGNGGNIVFFDDSLLSITDYSESTGTLVWSDTPFNNDFATQDLPINDPPTVAYGMLYAADTDGYMHAINITNGVQQWDSITRSGGLEMPEPGYPANGAFVADNEVFTSSFIYYESTPAYRGHCLYAFNALTGAQNWNISGEYFGVTISDGILMAQNLYDGKEYAFTPGPTATTVSVSSGNAQVGVPTIIQGTVTDQTPGPAQGTPAISDAWMTPWMQYLYMDQPYPTSATGVNVQLTAIDSNNNLISIGNATSNLDGLYKYTWTPPNVPGSYTIIATFNSDNSYYGSCAEIATYVASATSATPAPTATPTTVADMYFVPAIAGLFVLIIIVAIVLALLMLRKKP